MAITREMTDDAPSTLPDGLQFMQLLWAVMHGLQTTSKRMSHEIGVTGPQRLVLRVVGLFPGLSAGDLAAILHVHPSTLTGVLQRLVEQQLVIRVDDPRDRRRAVLRLTAHGKLANKVKSGTVESAVAAALEGISDAERQAAKRVLALVAAYLDRSADRQTRTARPKPRPASRPQWRSNP